VYSSGVFTEQSIGNEIVSTGEKQTNRHTHRSIKGGREKKEYRRGREADRETKIREEGGRQEGGRREGGDQRNNQSINR
jgi:hypothetical protein